MRYECPGGRGVYTHVMTKRIVAVAVFLGAITAGSAAFAQAKSVVVPKCRAVDKADPTKVVAEAEDKLTTKCVRLLQDKIKAGVCTEEANKGKKLEFVTQFDHMIGKMKMKDGKVSLTCPKP